MKNTDKELIEMYLCGFNDGLDCKTRIWNVSGSLLKAYNIGRMDALIGDDVRSSDLQSNEEILKRIKKPYTL